MPCVKEHMGAHRLCTWCALNCPPPRLRGSSCACACRSQTGIEIFDGNPSMHNACKEEKPTKYAPDMQGGCVCALEAWAAVRPVTHQASHHRPHTIFVAKASRPCTTLPLHCVPLMSPCTMHTRELVTPWEGCGRCKRGKSPTLAGTTSQC